MTVVSHFRSVKYPTMDRTWNYYSGVFLVELAAPDTFARPLATDRSGPMGVIPAPCKVWRGPIGCEKFPARPQKYLEISIIDHFLTFPPIQS
jgi:hypothetical protein